MPEERGRTRYPKKNTHLHISRIKMSDHSSFAVLEGKSGTILLTHVQIRKRSTKNLAVDRKLDGSCDEVYGTTYYVASP